MPASTDPVSLPLPPDDRPKLAEAKRLLTELTATHASACSCVLGGAHWRTDVRDEPDCRTAEGVTLAGVTVTRHANGTAVARQ